MRSRSNINSLLKKKRQLGLMKKVGVITIFALFFLSLIVLGLTSRKIEVNTVLVSGNTSIAEADIQSIVMEDLQKYYLWIIPTDNFFLLRKSSIQENILDKMKKIDSVKVSFDDLHTIQVAVSERMAENVWCDGLPAFPKSCFSMDKDGFIFEQVKDLSREDFPEYFGLVSATDPIGKIYFGKDTVQTASANTAISDNKFASISNFFKTLNKLNFAPKSFLAIDEHEYEVYLADGGKIMINDKKPFEQYITNLQALIDNGFIKTDKKSLKKINYIDLRFGNKVNFDLKN